MHMWRVSFRLENGYKATKNRRVMSSCVCMLKSLQMSKWDLVTFFPDYLRDCLYFPGHQQRARVAEGTYGTEKSESDTKGHRLRFHLLSLSVWKMQVDNNGSCKIADRQSPYKMKSVIKMLVGCQM